MLESAQQSTLVNHPCFQVKATKSVESSNFSKEDMDRFLIEFEVERSKRMDEMDMMIKMNQELMSVSTELVLARGVLKEENERFQEGLRAEGGFPPRQWILAR
ncbi:hypothetical protein LWI29_019252 [Acer saccharum]|uniref:Uncharacterized protein n=1 Tax=Acer saccharum TaxID=4024 RepID=A0AA39S3R1_ACESA|nr:hypothetical protein LWI29_019252 [Acer saccharum]